jgi:hypothetical protein
VAIVAVRQYRIEAHKAWMIRGSAVTFSFVTFRMLIEMPLWSAVGDARLAVVLSVSWVAPPIVTEVVLRSARSELSTRAYLRAP